MSLRDYLFHEEPGITLYCGDCRDVLPLLRCPNTSYCLEACDGRCAPFSLVLTDPPYEVEAHTLQRRAVRGRLPMTEPCPFDAITPELRSASLSLLPVVHGWVLVFCQAEAVAEWRRSMSDAGIRYMRSMVWVKPDAMPQYTGDRPGMGYETIVAGWAGPGRSKWNGAGRVGVFTHNKNDPFFADGRNAHPTQKPETLLSELVTLFSNSGDMILDPFAGSGTTLLVAKTLGRRAIGIEIEPRYCEIAVKRLRQEVLPF